MTESDLLIQECRLAQMAEAFNVLIQTSRHAAEGWYKVADLSTVECAELQRVELQRVESRIVATATFDANELYVEFNDLNNLDFWMKLVLDLDTMQVIKIDGRHQPSVDVSDPTRRRLVLYNRPLFRWWISENLVHIHDDAAGAKQFKIVSDLSEIMAIFQEKRILE